MQRLHAYAHIKKLLKRGNKAEREGLEDDDARALQLALDNNFVTSLTSLVVTTAQNGTTLASLGNDIVEDVPHRRGHTSVPYSNYGIMSYSGGSARSGGVLLSLYILKTSFDELIYLIRWRIAAGFIPHYVEQPHPKKRSHPKRRSKRRRQPKRRRQLAERAGIWQIQT